MAWVRRYCDPLPLDAETDANAYPLTIFALDRALTELAGLHGAGSGARRAEALHQLFSGMTGAERSFLLRLLAGDLRQGALEGIMIDAVAAAADLPPALVRRAAMYSKSLGAVARAALLEGAAGLGRFRLELFSPVAPMLAQTATDVEEALEQLGGEAHFEWKMDGARIQVHHDAADTRVYTRGLNEVSLAVPEIVAAVRGLGTQRLVLDGEAIAFDAEGRPHPFQITMRRFGRRLKVDEMATELPIRAYFFDCLLCEGEDLTGRTARERFSVLARSYHPPYRCPTGSLRPSAMPATSTMLRSRRGTKVSWPNPWSRHTRPETAGQVG